MNVTNDETLTWTVLPSKGAPGKRIVVFLAAVTAGVAGVVFLRSPLFGLLGFAMILAATAEFWLGVRYSIGPKGASRKVGLSLTHIDWTDVKRVILDGATIRLSPLAEEGRLDAFRGVTLAVPEESRAKVRELIEYYCQTDVRFLGS